MTTPPGPKGLPILGSLQAFNRERLGFLLEMAREYGDVVHYRLLNYAVYQLNHPDYVQAVLVEQAGAVEKNDLDKAIFNQSLGHGILSSEGEFHRAQRRLMQPAFHSKRIEAYGQVMTDYTERMLTRWAEGQTLDVHHAMTHLTMQIVSKTLYDADVGDEADGIGAAIDVLNRIGGEEFQQGYVLPQWIPTAKNRQIKRAVRQLDGLMMPIIEQRRSSGEDKGDLLSMLLISQDEDTGGRMTDRQVRDEAVTLFVAGHETTSNLLAWTWYLLAQHPTIEAQLHAELDSVLKGRTPTMRDLGTLQFTDWVIKEALRLYPPAWILNGRKPKQAIDVGGYTIPAGSLIFMSPYVLQRDPRYFDDAETFQPQRWADGLEKRIPRYAYFPFGGGPRVCIGNQFALMEARLVLATIAQRYRLALSGGAVVEPDALITLRPKNGIMMRVTAREKAEQPASSEPVVA